MGMKTKTSILINALFLTAMIFTPIEARTVTHDTVAQSVIHKVGYASYYSNYYMAGKPPVASASATLRTWPPPTNYH